MKQIEKWITIALINLAIVASLGLLMRAKMLFSMPYIDFKNILHSHSHYAFGGWITLAMLTLMVSQLLPAQQASKKVYQWLLAGLLVPAVGMLVSFPFQGYGLFSITFSTLFIFATYAFAFVFLKDFWNTQHSQAVKLLTVFSIGYLVVSSVGPFTLGYTLATKSADAVLYKNAIYTYLHLQYSGFFTLAVFALALRNFTLAPVSTLWFARLLTYSVVPSMFASYLWSYQNAAVYTVAIIGSTMLVLCLFFFFAILPSFWQYMRGMSKLAKQLLILSMVAFVLKMVLQAFTIVPALGDLVFANRPIIIGFLHLVLLGFVTIYLLAQMVESRFLPDGKWTKAAVWVFVAGITFNELVLMAQGLGVMFMVRVPHVNWLLLGAALCLFTGALLIAITRAYAHRAKSLSTNNFSINYINL